MRKLLLIVVVAACAKSSAPRESSKSSAEATGGATADQAPQQAPPPPAVNAPAPTTAAEPDMQPKGGGPGGGGVVGAAPADNAKAKESKEIARAQGVLGPTDQDLFTPIEPGIAKIEKGPIAPTAKAIQACYDKVRAKDTTVVGELTLKFKYNADGTTADVVIDKSTVKSTELETCVVDVLKAAKLTPAKAAAKATARISFKKA